MSANEQYTYIHFLQGSDLPVKNQNDIHCYFDKTPGVQYVNIEQGSAAMAQRKSHYYHLFCHNRFFRKHKFMKMLNFGLVAIQKVLHISHNRDIEVFQGSALFSITYDCACFLLSKQAEIKKRFRFALAPDEVFVQTMLMNSPYRAQIKDVQLRSSSNARLIDRSRPDGKNSPHVWRKEELSFILNQPEEICFARKFDENIDFEIVQNIYHNVKI